MLERILGLVDALPPFVVYVGLGLGAAIENVLPAIPADTFVLLGGFLAAARPALEARWIWVSTWLLNAGSALLLYRVGHTHGRSFFERGWGRRLLNPHQMERMQAFYDRFGTPAVLFTRFLPGLRSIVPVFAGVTHQRPGPVAAAVLTASAIWYGVLVWAGTVAGHNLEAVQAAVGDVNVVLLAVAVAIGVAVAGWWWRTRHHDA